VQEETFRLSVFKDKVVIESVVTGIITYDKGGIRTIDKKEAEKKFCYA